jgi:hypothetical protein
MLDTDSFKDFVTLHAQKKRLENQLKDVKYAIQQKEQFLIDNLQTNDMSKISISGKTCYTKVNTYAVISNKQAAIQLLKENGYGDFVTENYNTNSISKLVRDLLDENDGQLPAEFGTVITKGQSAKLNVINS